MADNNLDHLNLLSKDARVADGVISLSSDLRVNAFVRMNIISKKKVVVSNTAEISGDIEAREVYIYGKVAGNIRAVDSVKIFRSGDVNGKVSSRSLLIEEGAKCNCEFSVSKEEFRSSNNKKRLFSSTAKNGTERPSVDSVFHTAKAESAINREITKRYGYGNTDKAYTVKNKSNDHSEPLW